MSRQISFHHQANDELDESVRLYEARRDGLGEELRRHAESIFEEILRQPNRFPRISRTTRSAAIIKFGFDVIYRELPNGDVRIIAVYHHARQPGGWKNRR